MFFYFEVHSSTTAKSKKNCYKLSSDKDCVGQSISTEKKMVRGNY
jgi:hypothetical protein